jgi:UDP-N-acetylglucosamine--N-acetylmuramyl-(pentapeptide) pyrophosphoryl-undecaprenol N-acetylglucosamine transferase
VIGLGGYGSAPMGRAAIAQGIPLMLMEQNMIPGKATRWLARSARLVCAAHEAVRPYFAKGCPLAITGNPVRDEVAALSRQRRLTSALVDPDRPGKLRLVVLGGTRGAQSLNQALPYALYRLRDRLESWHILHQSGADDLEPTRQLYRKFALPARVEPFFADVAGVLRHTDLVVSRAGGTTLAELACAGVPAVCVPYPHAADGHQLANAQTYARSGACRVFDSTPYADRFDAELSRVLSDELTTAEIREQMSQGMRRMARPDAAEQVAQLAWEVLAGVSSRQAA